jgi:hypothetical protein
MIQTRVTFRLRGFFYFDGMKCCISSQSRNGSYQVALACSLSGIRLDVISEIEGLCQQMSDRLQFVVGWAEVA